jgi:tartrate-resistant acid phosphatase type 5
LKYKLLPLGFFIFSLICCPLLDAKGTIPDSYDEPLPASIQIPKDLPLSTPEAALKSNGNKILVFGDSGTGDETQMKVAKAMKEFCGKNGCQFALMLGDNFYPAGVESADDPQFIEKFETPYAGLGIPIFVVLGEHDWGRKGDMYNWKAQIDYSQKSKFWHMPSDVYSITLENIKIFALNTNSFPISKYQKNWLKEELGKSTARWNLVFGHKPIYSYGYHGDTKFMIEEALPILCGRADLYLAGHEHNDQVLRADCGLPLVISGSAGKPHLEKASGPRTLFASTEPGFTYLHIKNDELVVQMVSVTGEIQYKLVIPKK